MLILENINFYFKSVRFFDWKGRASVWGLCMRIITGRAKGCKLKAPKGWATRPTADRVKESLFNILGGRVLDAEVLDLFSGTGNLALEALSRGARRATMVDSSAESVRVMRDNALHTKLSEHAQIVRDDVLEALQRLRRAGRMFTLVFCDPPYSRGLAEAALAALDAPGLLAEDALVVVEHAPVDLQAMELEALRLARRERYGAAMLSFFVKHAESEM